MVASTLQPPIGFAALRQQLSSSPYWPLRQVACDAEREMVVLRGTVSSYYLRQLAESLATRLVGVEQLQSHIHVAPE